MKYRLNMIKIKVKNLKNILVIRFSAMGDVVLTVPVIQNLLRKYPDTQITVLTNSFYHPFFEGISNLTLYPVDLKGKHKGILGLWKLVKELTSIQQFDAVIDLHSVMRSWVMGVFFRLKGIKVYKIDKGRSEKKAFIQGKTKRALPHTTQRYQKVFKQAGFDFKLEKSLLPITKPTERLDNILSTFSKITIGVAPFAAHKSKEWGLDKIKELIHQINLKSSVQFYLFGGGDKEVTQLTTLANDFENVTNVAGQFSLQEEIQVLRNLSVFIGMDSGNAHIASLTGISVLTIWGGTHPDIGFSPLYQEKDNCILPKKSIEKTCQYTIYGTSEHQMKEAPYFCIARIEVKRILERLAALGILKT